MADERQDRLTVCFIVLFGVIACFAAFCCAADAVPMKKTIYVQGEREDRYAMKIKIRIGAVHLALLFFCLIFIIILYSIYTGGSQDPIFPTVIEVFLGLGFAAIIAMLLGK